MISEKEVVYLLESTDEEDNGAKPSQNMNTETKKGAFSSYGCDSRSQRSSNESRNTHRQGDRYTTPAVVPFIKNNNEKLSCARIASNTCCKVHKSETKRKKKLHSQSSGKQTNENGKKKTKNKTEGSWQNHCEEMNDTPQRKRRRRYNSSTVTHSPSLKNGPWNDKRLKSESNFKSSENYEKEEIEEPYFLICRSDGDDGILTTGLASLIENLSTTHIGTVATYLHPAIHKSKPIKTTISLNENLKNQAIHKKSLIRELAHIEQMDKWTCGFRNMQMLLSALLPNVPEYHPIHSFINSLDDLNSGNITNGTKITTTKRNINDAFIVIPSIKQFQHFIEEAWQEGFDPEGKRHYNNRMVGKTGHNAKVGAVEISCILSYLFVDTTVVQFIVCKASRSLLSHFMWAYFNREAFDKIDVCTGNGGFESSSLEISSNILKNIELNQSLLNSSSKHNAGSCTSFRETDQYASRSLKKKKTYTLNHPLLPLYLQWEGHSVTCIGIEKVISKNTLLHQDEFNIIIFDPNKRASDVKNSLVEMNKLGHSSYSPHRSQKKRTIRISSKELMKKDCQLLVSTVTPIDDNMRRSRSSNINSNVITAANDIVESHVKMR